MSAAPGLRERKKAATRQALHEAALRLAVEHGLERVTVEAIADAAAVSRRTFSNYFANKEEAIFYGDRVRMQRLLSLVRERPTGEPPRVALHRAAEELIAETDRLGPDWLVHRRSLRGHPALLTYQVAAYAAIERELAAEVVQRMPADATAPLRARVLAATLLATLRAATQFWLEQPDRPLPELVSEALHHAET